MKAWTKAGRGSAPGSPGDGGRRRQKIEDAGREAAIMELGGTWARTAGPGKAIWGGEHRAGRRHGKEEEREGIFGRPSTEDARERFRDFHGDARRREKS
jgi:hypothetical protein